jgi:hypothetical protein
MEGITGVGVVVTILDDGLEKDHPDLFRNYVSRTSLWCRVFLEELVPSQLIKMLLTLWNPNFCYRVHKILPFPLPFHSL